jgi:hypothetical protein
VNPHAGGEEESFVWKNEYLCGWTISFPAPKIDRGDGKMPLDYLIDNEKKLVRATARGKLTSADVFAYQRAVWTRPDVVGFNELVDMTNAEEIDAPSTGNVRHLAGVSAEMDSRTGPGRLAIVAPSDLAYGLGRMYATFRDLDKRSSRKVSVFREMDQALVWLAGGDEDVPNVTRADR